MPIRSKSQWRALWAKANRGEISPAKVREMAAHTPGGYKSLPKRKRKMSEDTMAANVGGVPGRLGMVRRKKPKFRTIKEIFAEAGELRRHDIAPSPPGSDMGDAGEYRNYDMAARIGTHLGMRQSQLRLAAAVKGRFFHYLEAIRAAGPSYWLDERIRAAVRAGRTQ